MIEWNLSGVVEKTKLWNKVKVEIVKLERHLGGKTYKVITYTKKYVLVEYFDFLQDAYKFYLRQVKIWKLLCLLPSSLGILIHEKYAK